MNRATRIVTALSVAAAAALTVAVVALRPASSPAGAAGAAGALALHVPPGTYVEHDIDIEETTRGLPFGAAGAAHPMEGATTLRVRLRLEAPRDAGAAAAPAGGAQTLRARFVEVREARLVMDGKDVLPAEAAEGLLAATAEIDRAPTGEVTALRVPQSADPTFQRLLAYALGEARVSLGAGDAWTAEERLARGAFSASWRVASRDADRVQLARGARTLVEARGADIAKSEVRGDAKAVLRSGVLEALDASEAVALQNAEGEPLEDRSVTVRVRLAGEGRLDEGAALASAAPATFDRASARAALVDDVPLTDDAGADALKRRADGLTREGLRAQLATAATTGAVGDPQRFIWRAAAVLRLDAGAVDDIAELFVQEGATTKGRALLLDVLVAAGSGHAQDTLASLLDDPVVAEDPSAVILRQRMALLRAPAPQTVAFLDAHAGDDAGSWRDPARLALGAAVARRLALGDPAGADAAWTALAREAQDIGDDVELERVLMAYGNTRDARALPLLEAHAGSAKAQVRHVVAGALRGIDSDAARARLLALGVDADPAVARRAWESLQVQPPSAALLEAARDGVATRRVPDTAWNEVVSLCAKHLQDPALQPAALATLQAVVDQAGDARLVARARTLLRRHTAG